MAKKWIEARVIQKIDTLENWNNNPLILYDGEQAFVKTENGISINFKMGDGTRAFKDLPYWIDYGTPSQQVYTSTDWNSKKNGVYIPVESGNYRGVQVDLTKGFTVLIWDGINSLTQVVYPFTVNADGIIEEGNTKPVSGDTVWQALKDLGNVVDDVQSGNMNPVTSNAVYNHTLEVFEAVRIGSILNWVAEKTYRSEDVVKHLGLIWVATKLTKKPPNSNDSGWELYNPYGKSYGKIVGKPENVIFNSVNGNIEFKGSNANQASVICEMGIVTIKPSTISNTEDYAVLVVDYKTGVVSEAPNYSYKDSVRPVNKVPFAVIINNDSGRYELFGVEAYTKKDGDVTQIYPPNIIGKGEAVTGSQNDIPNVEFMNDAIKEAVESGGVDTSAFVKTKGDNKLDNTFTFSRNGKKIKIPFVGTDSTIVTSIEMGGFDFLADAAGRIVLPAGGGEGGGTIDNVSVNGVDAPIIDKRAELIIDKDTVGLGKVDNTSDAEKKPNQLVKEEIAKQIAESGTGGGVELTNEYLPNDQTKATSSTAVKDFDTKTNDFTANADGGVTGKKYWIKGQPINIGNYYNKQEVDAKLADIEPSITLGYGLTKDSEGKVRWGEGVANQGFNVDYMPINTSTMTEMALIGYMDTKDQNGFFKSTGIRFFDGRISLAKGDATTVWQNDSEALVFQDSVLNKNLFQGSTFVDGKNRIISAAHRQVHTAEESYTIGLTRSNNTILGLHFQANSITATSLTIPYIDAATKNVLITKEWFQHQFSNVQPTVNGVKGVVAYTNDNQVKTIETTELIKRHTGINVLDKQYLLNNYSDTKFIEHEDKLIYNNNLRFFELQKNEIL